MGRVIPEEITELSMCEVFVFGSNLEGQHGGGAAKTAYEKFGAEWGVGSGPTGQCYAIPTMHGGLDDIKPYVDEFIEYARNHPNNRFLVTRVGCGIAGFTDEQMAPLFEEAWRLPNVNFPLDWALEFDKDKFIDAYLFDIIPEEKVIPLPDALTESDLKRLCEEYKYIIGSALIVPKPKIRIRYVLDTDKFGYASFGDFFMCEDGELYVWSYDKNNELPHNQDMVELIFGDECKYRRQRKHSFHRVIFAGVETPFSDYKGRKLYSGDVLRVWCKKADGSIPKRFRKDAAYLLAFGTLGENEDDNKALYACVLDNHFISLDMCARIERCGTVFYGLDWNEYPVDITQRCSGFQNGILEYEESKKLYLSEDDKRVLAKFTPNFDKECWKYHALEILEIEFDISKQ